MSENLPAEQRQAPSSQKDRMVFLLDAVRGRAPQLKTLLSQTGVDFDLFVEIFHRAMIKGRDDPRTDITTADAASVIQACIDSATAGVLPDGRRAAIVLFNANVAAKGQPKRWVKKAQFLLMYEGMLQIAYASGNFKSIHAQVVYDVDQWDYELGIEPWIKHKPGARPPRPEGPEYEIIAAYAVAKTTNGGIFIEIFEPEDIRKVMAVSKATYGPAKDWREAMVRKGPLRRLYKFLPRDARMEKLLEVDDGMFDQDLLTQDEAPKEERKLRAGFSPKPAPALTQSADPVIDVRLEPEKEPAPMDADEGYGEMMGREEPPAEAEPGQKSASATPEPDGEQHPPMFQSYERLLMNAPTWTHIRQALKALISDPQHPVHGYEDTPWFWAWERLEELRQAGGKHIDFISDPLLFECWLVGAEPDSDGIEGNWRIVSGMDAFKRADEADRVRITARVEGMLGR